MEAEGPKQDSGGGETLGLGEKEGEVLREGSSNGGPEAFENCGKQSGLSGGSQGSGERRDSGGL